MSQLKVRNEIAKKLTSRTFHDEFECAESIIKIVNKDAKERLIQEIFTMPKLMDVTGKVCFSKGDVRVAIDTVLNT